MISYNLTFQSYQINQINEIQELSLFELHGTEAFD